MLQALAESITDWNYFSDMANRHGVGALVYHNLEKLGFHKNVPEESLQLLRNTLMMSINRNAHKSEMLAETLTLLNHENIKTVLLKGSALELMTYGNAGLRQMTDVDVLLSYEDCLQARKILIDNDFSSLPLKSLFHKPIIAYTGKHLPTLTRNGFAIELHHELFGTGKNVLTKMLYNNSKIAKINGETAFLPEPQVFFLYLVKHLYLHEMNNESQLRLYTDLAVMIEKFRDEIINFDLLEFANRAGMQEILAWRLEPLRDLWGISFPEWVNEFINKWYNPASINKFVFFLKNPKGNLPENRSLMYRNTIKDIPGIHRKFLFVLGDLFPTIRFMKKRYNCTNSSKALLYYPLRWGKLWYLVK
jgi:hypothetical protein